MIGLNIAMTGTVLALAVTLVAGISGKNAPDFVKYIGSMVFILGAVAIVAGIIYAIWE